MEIDKIFENNKAWVANKIKEDKNYFSNLSKGQSPPFLYIGCSDSRVPAEQLMGLESGDVFVYKNIANVVSNLDLSSLSVINYAVVHLKVKHIIVCGHYYCGGVKAAMGNDDLGILNPWLKNIRDVYRIHTKELDSIEDEDQKYRRLIELNVQEQCLNVINIKEVQEASDRGEIQVHGWVYDIHTGKLIDLKIDFEEKVRGIKDIYRIE